MPRSIRGNKSGAIASATSSPIVTGTSQKAELTFDVMNNLMMQSEKRIISRLDDIVSRITSIEGRLDQFYMDQVLLSSEMDKVKEIVVRQQEQIEKLEAAQRGRSLIFSCIPENDVLADGNEKLSEDIDKITYLCSSVAQDFDSTSIAESFRLGRPGKKQKRPIKVTFKTVEARNNILRSQRRLRNDSSIENSFGLVFINPDRTPIMRLEEKRLRDKMRELKSISSNPSDVYIRAGKLFEKSVIVDQINVGNQLF